MTYTLRNAGAIVLGTLLSACTDIALQAINLPSHVAGDLRAQRGLAYGDQPQQRLDLYLPGPGVTPRRQLVVFIYGGAWTTGARGDYFFVAETLTAAGYAVAIPDYIKYPQGVFPAFVQDVAQSLGWLADNAADYVDFDSFVLMGHSAGAHTAALLITDTRYLQAQGVAQARIAAFVGLAGPYGFRPKEKKYRDIFANLDDFDLMRPQHFANGDEPPMLLLHGDDDRTVLPVNTRRFAARINEDGGRAETRFYPGVGHIAPVLALSRAPLRNAEIREDILDFLQREFPGAG